MTRRRPQSSMPLEGVRVVDLTSWWAGPLAATVMADYGAEVIKVEAIQRLDGFRGTGADPAVLRPWETSPMFNSVQRNKLGITLNLTSPRGRELLLRLIAVSDALVQNFSPRVMRQWGLDYQKLLRLNPSLVLLSVSGFGQTGPWKDYVAFAPTVESLSGLDGVSGYPGGAPLMHGTIQGDSIAALHGAYALCLALRRQRLGGGGCHIDLSQLETVTATTGELFLERQLTGQEPGRRGNWLPGAAPYGCFPARGEDEWIAIAVRTDEEWAALRRAMGEPAWAQEPALQDGLSRWRRRAELNSGLAAWTAGQDKRRLMGQLQQAGVPAGAVLSPKDALEDPQLLHQGFFVQVERAEVGLKPHPRPSLQFASHRPRIHRPAPHLGEHNRYAFQELLGLSTAEVAELEADQVIGTEPLGAGASAPPPSGR